MIKANIRFNKTFLIICSVLILLIAGGIFYFNQSSFPAGAVVVIEFKGAQLVVNSSTLSNIENIALQQNITVNKSLALERLEQLEVLNEQARQLNIKPTKDQIDATFNQQIQAMEAQGLSQALAQQNISRATYEASLRSSIEQDLTLQLLFTQEVVSKIQISDAQLFAAYNASPQQFVVPESISVKHILICYAGAPQCQFNLTKEQAQSSIIALYQMLQNNASFEKLAAQYSTDAGSAKNGGDIGPITQGQTVKEFEAAAVQTPVGSYSKPFESPYGFHIVSVYGRQAAQQLTFEQVAPNLRKQMILQQANILQQAYISGLMSAAKITVVG